VDIFLSKIDRTAKAANPPRSSISHLAHNPEKHLARQRNFNNEVGGLFLCTRHKLANFARASASGIGSSSTRSVVQVPPGFNSDPGITQPLPLSFNSKMRRDLPFVIERAPAQRLRVSPRMSCSVATLPSSDFLRKAIGRVM
jgi:hypothetical protein